MKGGLLRAVLHTKLKAKPSSVAGTASLSARTWPETSSAQTIAMHPCRSGVPAFRRRSARGILCCCADQTPIRLALQKFPWRDIQLISPVVLRRASPACMLYRSESCGGVDIPDADTEEPAYSPIARGEAQ
eukprot:scaffold634_cov401-Prasinococcus_capsulatus_cf.AAC.12